MYPQPHNASSKQQPNGTHQKQQQADGTNSLPLKIYTRCTAELQPINNRLYSMYQDATHASSHPARRAPSQTHNVCRATPAQLAKLVRFQWYHPQHYWKPRQQSQGSCKSLVLCWSSQKLTEARVKPFGLVCCQTPTAARQKLPEAAEVRWHQAQHRW